MGRDFYDIVFLMNDTKPSLEYLKDKNGISSLTEVKKKLLDKCSNLDFKQLSKDIEPFLFNSVDSKKVLYFREYIQSQF